MGTLVHAEATEWATVRIPNGTKPSSILQLGNKSLVAIRIPTVYTDGTLKVHGGFRAVRPSTFEAPTSLSDDAIITEVDTPGTDYIINVGAAADRWVPLDPQQTFPFEYIYLESSVNQGQDTDIVCAFRHV